MAVTAVVVSASASAFRAPDPEQLGGARDGVAEETLVYRASARKKPQFHSIIDSKELFGSGERTSRVTTRLDGAADEASLVITVDHDLGRYRVEEAFTCPVQDGGLRAGHLVRKTVGESALTSRTEEVDFDHAPMSWPEATYPEVMLPFVMRWQPRDKQLRAAYSWTNDRFVARVYYELRGCSVITVPAGKLEAFAIWMYPDLNDWIRLGSVLTRLAKPLLPRYNMWFEAKAPWRMLRFEGPYGPPGAPEISLELAE